jgi:hypothetical protein
LEVTGNLTEDAIAGEALIPQRVFLFKTCNEQKLRMGYAHIDVKSHSFILVLQKIP